MGSMLRLMRPHQYTKNLFLFVPAFFAFRLHDLEVLAVTSLGFLAFCLCASAVYVLNDWVDREDDRRHPVKKERPIAAGLVGPRAAFSLLTGLVLGGLGLAWILSPAFLELLGLYLALNLAYSLRLKHVPILDVTIIAVGFLLRLFAGAVLAAIVLSQWIVVMTFLLALFLGLAKRRDDVLLSLRTQERVRPVIDGYNLKFLDTAMAISAAVVLVAYTLWSLSPETIMALETDRLYVTALFVFLGILRYLQLAMVEEQSGSPSRVLLRDRFTQLNLLCWVGAFVWILYVDL